MTEVMAITESHEKAAQHTLRAFLRSKKVRKLPAAEARKRSKAARELLRWALGHGNNEMPRPPKELHDEVLKATVWAITRTTTPYIPQNGIVGQRLTKICKSFFS